MKPTTHRAGVLLLASLLAAALACEPLLTEEQIEQISDSLETLAPTLEAMSTMPPPAEPTDLPPTAMPDPRVEFSDPSGDLVSCQTGEPAAAGVPHIDVGDITLLADDSGLTLTALFPGTDDLAANFGSLGSFLAILMVDNQEAPQPPDPNVGTFGLGSMRIDAIPSGEGLQVRSFVRDDSGSYLQMDGLAEANVAGNELEIKVLPSRYYQVVNVAGFAVLSLNTCDLAGVEFDYSSGSPMDGLLTIDIDRDLDF